MHNLARYRVLRVLGAGAAGAVYLVEDRVLGGPPLALKRVAEASSGELRASFAREFAVLAQLSLPGVARVHDLGVMPAGEGVPAGPFFTRDYIDGLPLDAWARDRPLAELLSAFLKVLAITARLHARGVVHGDLKPANVVVAAQAAPWLIDFGLASASHSLARGASPLSGSGTPLYMAPEILAGGSSSRLGDVYALGATLWTCVTGRPPLAERADALSARLRGVLPTIEAPSDSVAFRVLEAAHWALAADPAARAPSVDELAARIERAAGSAPAAREHGATFVQPRPRGREEQLARLVRGVLGRTQAASSLVPRDGALAPATVLSGARGMGKSTLLGELKWRLQLEGVRVLELHCRESALSTVAQLARQLALLGPTVPGLDALCDPEPALRTPADRKAAVQTLALALTAEAVPAVLLVDDLDREGSLLTEALRLALHGERGRMLTLLASGEALDAPGLATFVDLESLPLEPLDVATQQALIREALGPVDATTADVLTAHADGNPGRLIEALLYLFRRGDLTARDLSQLAPGEMAAGLARERAAALPDAGRALALLLSLTQAPVPEDLLAVAVGADYASARERLLFEGLARGEGGALFGTDAALGELLRRTDAERAASLARALLEVDGGRLDPVARADLALAAGDDARVRVAIEPALAALSARGAAHAALRLCEASLARGLGDGALQLAASELHAELGDCARAAALAEQLLASQAADDVLAPRARIVAARAHVTGGQLERAVALLSTGMDEAPPRLRTQAARELARVHVRRGEAESAARSIGEGLRSAPDDEPGRAELLALDATLACQRGDEQRAARTFDEALTLARSLAAAREEAQVLGYRALSHERHGALAAARTDYEAGLAAARRAGDLGLTATYAHNLGNVAYRAGHLVQVEENLALAARLSRRSGRMTTALLADNNLANLHVHLGSFARARMLAEHSLAEAEQLTLPLAQAHAHWILAKIDARTERFEAALGRFENAFARYRALGRTHEQAEIYLDAADLLLERAGVSDGSLASAKLATTRELIDRHAHEGLRGRLRLLIARTRAGHGDVAGAVKELQELARTLHPERERDLLWQVLAAESDLHAQLGSSLLAARRAREAAEIIELLASFAPAQAREGFCQEPRRRRVLERVTEARDEVRPERVPSGDEPRFARLLELIKRLARERDLDRLLERITDAAVDLSGAERGFVLLVDERGQLMPHTVRASGGAENDPHVAFSRSIAEAVLIDGEPIVTVNARDDRRLNEYMSVHKLMLKSVACIPISGPVGVSGVLYLEHRTRAGRFREEDVDLLVAFADQAAIALENARLWRENERRQRELEHKAAELAETKAHVEQLLATRTEELEQVRRDLGRARAELSGKQARHGIVGQGPAMRRVFALIERVADSPVPVVIEGESGTGKELVARAIHAAGVRRKEPFVAINCAALPEQLLESELFGHVRGAFTGADRDKRGLFAQAHRGTLFLDEFADMPQRMQIDLLRVLQERTIRPVGADHDLPLDVRVIAATNRPLKQLVASGRLREDLYYRMSVVELRLPPLRERPEDIPTLCEHFLSRASGDGETSPRRLSRVALDCIVKSELPGNVRQLEHMLTSAAMLADGPQIEPHDLPLEVRDKEPSEPVPEPLVELVALDAPGDVQGFKLREKRRILDALEQHSWNRAKAASALGMPRRTFYRRLAEFNIL